MLQMVNRLITLSFTMQCKHRRSGVTLVDVDLECLRLLEVRMFTQGRQVWGKGKGVGNHQDDWDPAEGIEKPAKRASQQHTILAASRKRRKKGS